jgi:L-seryl-tRNA(Ser) seleniumtransferase
MDGTDGGIPGLRGLPQVQRLLERPEAAPLLRAASRPVVVAALRAALAGVRAELLAPGGPAAAPSMAEILDRAGAALRAPMGALGQPSLRRVINATGIVLHTNLGRAPLAPEAAAAVAEAAAGYSNLEFDLDAGERGSRTAGIEPLLRQVTGAEAALAVNNNAAAVLLALSALAGGGEVVVSRGELVEIGGGFRIPDVIRQGGARLVEVGTTNRTRLADYRDAITPATRVLLKVHQSNYRIVGFTAAASTAELAALARERGLLLVEDQGSGTLADLHRLGRPHEPTVREAVEAGADLVAFSGDKLLGGPQAGLLVGRRVAVDPLRKHPLLRALRLDKLTLAALEATLRLHLDEDGAARRLPVLWMLAQGEAALQDRAERLTALLPEGANSRIEPTTGYAGGGSLPDEGVPSRAVSLAAPGIAVDTLARRLRAGRPAVVGRLRDGRLLLDVLAVADAELPDLAGAVQGALA